MNCKDGVLLSSIQHPLIDLFFIHNSCPNTEDDIMLTKVMRRKPREGSQVRDMNYAATSLLSSRRCFVNFLAKLFDL